MIGLKIQALVNDPEHRSLVDAPDIQRILHLHKDTLDMSLVRGNISKYLAKIGRSLKVSYLEPDYVNEIEGLL
ncbi:MAG: hypothetical protein V2B13_13970 [Pseudomonadota bacterium]